MQLPNTLNKKGSMLIEIGLAFALLAFILSAASMLTSEILIQKTTVIQTEHDISTARTALDTTLYLLTHSFYSPLVPSSTTITDITPCRKNVVASVNSITLQALSINIKETKALGYDCEEDMFADELFTHSSSLSFPETFLTSDIFHHNIIVAATSTSNTSYVSIIDVKNFPTVQRLSSLSIDSPITALDAASSYVYLATGSTTGQLQIVDIHDLSSPLLISTTTLPNVSGSYPGATSIFYFDSKIYIGTHRTAGHEFHIFDVTNPRAPLWLGSIELNHNINDIIVRDGYAYLGTSGNTKNLIILDVHNPSAITQVSSLSATGTEDTTSLYLLGTMLYMGRTTSSKHDPDFYCITVEDPLHPVTKSMLTLGNTVTSILATSHTLFAALKNKSLVEIDNPHSGSDISIGTTTTLQSVPTALDAEDNTVYITEQNSLTTLSP